MKNRKAKNLFKKDILDLLREKPMTPSELVREFGTKKRSVGIILRELIIDKILYIDANWHLHISGPESDKEK